MVGAVASFLLNLMVSTRIRNLMNMESLILNQKIVHTDNVNTIPSVRDREGTFQLLLEVSGLEVRLNDTSSISK